MNNGKNLKKQQNIKTSSSLIDFDETSGIWTDKKRV